MQGRYASRSGGCAVGGQREKTRCRTFVAIAIVACLARLAVSHPVLREFVDDAYIYLRYCDNWDAGPCRNSPKSRRILPRRGKQGAEVFREASGEGRP